MGFLSAACIRTLDVARRLFLVLAVWLAAPLAAHAALTATPISWDIVGLDSNDPASGPRHFPVGARVCSNVATTNVQVSLVWDSANPFIALRSGSLSTLTFPALGAGACADAYFEAEVAQNAAAFNTTRRYHIAATDSSGTASTPVPRELYVERLVSQNRNALIILRYGPDLANLVSVPAGGSLDLVVGQTYVIELSGTTATQGYDQLEAFINFTNSIFQILDVDTTYSADSSPIVPNPNDRLWANACGWESDPNSPNYRGCTGSGKVGGSITTFYTVRIISGGGSSQALNTLVHDFSGSSYHYNSDFSTGIRIANIIDPATSTISKVFAPNPTTLNGISVLTLTISNPNAGTLTGYNFVDSLPANMTIASPAAASTSGCGAPTLVANAGSSQISFSNGTVAGAGSCTIKVNVTTSTTGSFLNTTGNLFVGAVDTGDNATATLVVNNEPPPGPGLCGQELARWTFPNAFNVNSPAPTSASVATSTAAGAGILPNTQTNIPNLAVAPAPDNTIAWGSNGSINTADLTLDPSLNEYFEFAVDTTGIASLQISFDAKRNNNGPRGVSLYHGTTNTRPETGIEDFRNDAGLPSAMTSVAFSSGQITTGINPSGSTYFRIYFHDSINTNPGSDPAIDNVLITACGPGIKPTIAKSFAPDPIVVGGTSTLTFSLTNTNSAPLTGAAFTDVLPADVQVATTPAAASTCGGTWAPTAGSTNLVFTGGVIPPNGTCTLGVNVTATTAGTKTNISGFLSTTETGTTTTSVATDTLTVIVPPAIAKQFAPSSILPAGVSTLTFTITNPNPDSAASSVAFTDTFPAGMVVASPPSSSTNGCGAPTFTAVAGSGSVVLSGGTIAALGTCTVTVAVTVPTPGSYVNTTGPVSFVVAAITVNGNTATDTLTVTAPNPQIGLLKQVSTSATGPWLSFQSVNLPGNVFYRFVVENLGDAPLSAVSVSDPLVSTASCTWPSPLPVAVVANENHIATCVVGPVAAVAGQTVNTATAQGTFGPTTATDVDSATYATSALTIDKSAMPATYAAAGNVVAYTFLVTNSGFASLAGPVVVTDDQTANETCPALATVGDLDNFFDPGESITCTATYTITVGDISNASVVNIASASSGGTSSPTDTATVVLVGPRLALTKTASPSVFVVGSPASYTITVENTGTAATSADIIVTDALPPGITLVSTTGANWGCTGTTNLTCTFSGSLAVSATTTLTLNVAVAAGTTVATNTATVSGGNDPTCPAGAPCTDTVTVPVVTPELNTAKALTGNADGDGSGTITQGDVLTYTITVTNTGSVTLTNVVVTDSLIVPTGGTTPCASVAAGATCTLVGTYTVGAGDITTGSITNTGTGDSDQTPPDSDTLITPVSASPALDTAKQLTSNADGDSSGTITQGDVLTYTITVTNTGNVPLNSVTVSDPMITRTGGSSPCSTVAVGATCTLVGTYTVTGTDVTAGSISNTGTGDSEQTPPDDDTLVTPINGSPALSTAKALVSNADGDGSGTVTLGDVLTYSVTVTNTGNIALTNVVVTDARITRTGGSAPCASLAVAGTCTLVGTYTVAAADVLAGNVTNTGSGDSDQTPPDTDTIVTPVLPLPDLTVDKSHTGNFTEGQVGAQYSVVVRNVGTGTSFGAATLADTLPTGFTATAIAGTGWSCTLATLSCTRADPLAASASWPTITVTVNVGASLPAILINTATISGGGDNTPANNTDTDPATIIDATPTVTDLMIDKVGSGVFIRGQAGAIYALRVGNVGAIPATGVVTVVDLLPPGLTATAMAGPGWSCVLATTTCTRSDPLPVGGSYPLILLAATVQLDAPPSIANTATVSAAIDTDPDNNSDLDIQPVAFGVEPAPALPVPVDARWALMLLALAMAAVAYRRRAGPARR